MKLLFISAESSQGGEVALLFWEAQPVLCGNWDALWELGMHHCNNPQHKPWSIWAAQGDGPGKRALRE